MIDFMRYLIHNIMCKSLRVNFAMKVIQVPMDEKLLRALTRRAKVSHTSRSAFVREACQRHLERLDEEDLDRQYVEGYRRKPENPAVGKTGAKLAAIVWPREQW